MNRMLSFFLVSVLVIGAGFWGWTHIHATPTLIKASPLLRVTGSENEKVRPEGPQPKVSAVDRTFDFGSLDQDKRGSHTFEISNEGEAPLTIRFNARTCGCTTLRLGNLEWTEKVTASPTEPVEIAPGEKIAFEMSWNTEKKSGKFRTSAKLSTNDFDRPDIEFAITGEIVPIIELTEGTMVIPSLRTSDKASRGFGLYSRAVDDFEVTNIESTDPHIVAKLVPMTDDEKGAVMAKRGYRGVVEVMPGLPSGPLNTIITFHTNRDERPEVMLNVTGKVEGDVLMTPDEELNFKFVKVSEGGEAHILILIRGDESVQVTIAKIEPAFLQDKIQIERLSAGRFKLTGKVPPGSPGGRFAGIVELETTHPVTKQIKIPVKGNIVQ